MPEMSGMEAAKLIKSNRLWAQIPLIFLTADSDPTTEAACLKLGADDFIIKPVVPLVISAEFWNLRSYETSLKPNWIKKQNRLKW